MSLLLVRVLDLVRGRVSDQAPQRDADDRENASDAPPARRRRCWRGGRCRRERRRVHVVLDRHHAAELGVPAMRNATSTVALNGSATITRACARSRRRQRQQQAEQHAPASTTAIAVTPTHREMPVPSFAEASPRACFGGVRNSPLPFMRAPAPARRWASATSTKASADDRQPAAAR